MNTPYLTFFLLWLGHFLVDYMIGVWAIYKTLVGLDVAVAGMIAGASAFAGEGMQLVFGGLSDRGYRKMLIAIGVSLTTCSALMGYTQEYSVLFVLFLLTCMGSGAFHPSAAGLVGKLAGNRKSLFMTIFQSGGAFGLATSQLIFVALYNYLDGQTLVLVIPSFCLVAAVVFFGLAETSAPVTSEGKIVDLKVFLGFFKNRDLRNLYIAQMLNQSLVWGFIFLLPDLLLYRQYPEWLTFGGAHLCYILGGAFMIIPGGWLADRVGSKQMIFYSQLIACVLFYFFLSNTFLPPVLVCVLLSLLGASQGIVSPIVLAMGTQLVPNRPGMVSAFLMGLVWCIAEGVGQGGGGLMTKLFSENATAKSLAILGILPVISLWVVNKLPQRETQKMELAV